MKASAGPRYVVGCRNNVEKTKLVLGTRVTLDMTTLTIMRILPREVDPVVYNMSTETPGDANYGSIGGLNEQIRELREVKDVIHGVNHISSILNSIKKNLRLLNFH